MIVGVDSVDIDRFIVILKNRMRRMWLHRLIFPNCNECKCEMDLINRLSNSKVVKNNE